MTRLNPLVRRAVLTEKTRAKFFGRPFRLGSCDCAKVAASHAKLFGWKVPPPGRYTTLEGARARLGELGCDHIFGLVDKAGLPPIAPARAMTGDIVGCAGELDFGGLGIVLGNGLMLAFHEDAIGMAIVRMEQVERAWSILPARASVEEAR